MATNRTGTAQWKRIRKAAIARAIREDLDQCPSCGTQLDLRGTGEGAPVDVDHIIPYAHGGQDTLENVVAMCSRCNRSKGAGQGRKPHPVTRVEPATLIDW